MTWTESTAALSNSVAPIASDLTRSVDAGFEYFAHDSPNVFEIQAQDGGRAASPSKV